MYQYHFLYCSAQNYKIKSKAIAIFVIESTNRIICTYFRENCWGWHHSRSDCKRLSTMTYHFILKIVRQYMKLNICKVLSSLQYRKYFPHMSLRLAIIWIASSTKASLNIWEILYFPYVLGQRGLSKVSEQDIHSLPVIQQYFRQITW